MHHKEAFVRAQVNVYRMVLLREGHDTTVHQITIWKHPDKLPFQVYCNHFFHLKIVEKISNQTDTFKYLPFLSAIESKKHQGASCPAPHFTKAT